MSRPGASQLEAPSLEINIFKEYEAARLEIDISSRIHKGQISFRQGAQTAKSSSRALEAPGLGMNIFLNRFDKQQTGFGQGSQIGKSSSRALEAPMLEISVFIKIIYKESTAFRQ